MQFDSLHCSVCYNEYNLDDHIPRILPKCGHTICSLCLESIMKHPNPKCPLDKLSLKTRQDITKAFPINFTVRSFLEESAEQEMCTTHLRELKLICLDDHMKVCKHCIPANDHKDHNLKPIKEIKIETDNRRKKLGASLNMMTEYYKEANAVLKSGKVNLSKKITEGFDELAAFLEAKKLDLLFELDVKFNREKKRLDELYGEGSSLRKDIQGRIEVYDEIMMKKDFLKMMEANGLQPLGGLDEYWMKENIGEFNAKVGEFLGSFDKAFNSQKQYLNSIVFPQEDMVRSVKLDGTKENKVDFLAGDQGCVKIRSSMQINNNRELGFLEVVVKGQSFQELTINVNEWKDVRHIFICLEEPRLIQENLMIVAHLVNKLEHINTITVKADNQEEICEEGLSQLLTTLFSRPKKLQQIRISLNFCKIGDRTASMIAEKVLPRATSLEKFLLSLRGTQITDKAVELLADNLMPFTKNLTSFRVNLGDTTISEKAVSRLFMCMPKVKKLMIGLDSVYITDETLDIFVRHMLSSMSSLEELYLDYQNTKISSRGVTSLFERLWSIASVRLIFEEAIVTEKCVKALKQNKLMKPELLKNFNISLYSNKEIKRVINQELWKAGNGNSSGTWLWNLLGLGS